MRKDRIFELKFSQMNTFLDDLSNRLTAPLPGRNVQDKMRATRSNGQAISFTHQGPVRQGGVAILLYPDQGKWHLPLIKRTEYPGVHSGQISLPGGKMDPDDLSLTHTAIREINEELGLNLGINHVVGELTELYIIASHFNILPVVLALDESPKINPDPREVQQVFTTSLNDLILPETRREKELLVRGHQLWAPYFDVNKQIVWGATAMILSEFLEVVRESGYC